MKKLLKHSILVLLFCFSANACFTQKGMISEERSVGQFDAINVCCGINVYISDGESSKLKVEINSSNKDLFDNIITEVKNNKLDIRLSKNDDSFWKLFSIKGKEKVNIYLSATNLKSISASSGSDVSSVNRLKAKNISISASSGSDIKLDLHTENLSCDASSGSDIELKGSALSAKLSASSGSDIKLKEMTVAKVVADVSSGADIKVSVSEELKADASSGGDIEYYGNPKIVNTNTSSGGDIKAKN